MPAFVSALVSATGYSIVNAQPIDAAKLQVTKITEASDSLFQAFIDGQEMMLRNKYARIPDTSAHPGYRTYATVVVNGREVASVDNNGFLISSNALGAKLGDQLPGSVNGKTGPVLAQARAEVVARMLGGTVKPAASAMTQTAYEAMPKLKVTYDATAMTEDPIYDRIQELRRARTLFLAQQMA